MPQASDLSRDLRRWRDSQSNYLTIKQLAERTGIPYSSLKKYFAGQKWPRARNRQTLFNVTRLEILQPTKTPQGSIPSKPERAKPQLPPRRLIPKKISRDLDRRLRFTSNALVKLSESLTTCLIAITSLVHFLHNIQDNPDSRLWSEQARTAQGLLDALERVLRLFLESPQRIQFLRSHLSGPDAGYLSGLLAALFDDTRLSNWKAMTTYTYGGSRRGRRIQAHPDW